jgi:hypothetical protein
LINHGHQDEGNLPTEHPTLLGCQSRATSSPGKVTHQELDLATTWMLLNNIKNESQCGCVQKWICGLRFKK